MFIMYCGFFLFKQKTAYEMRISDWSSDVVLFRSAWQGVLHERGLDVAPLQPANCGFDIGWSEHFAGRHAGAPLKPVVARWSDAAGVEPARQGECVVTQTGIEGSLVYALSSAERSVGKECVRSCRSRWSRCH